ncbi:MAG: phosphoribosylanthranilate isomerase [Pseudomonadota bacterium]
MDQTRVKICGLSEPDHVKAAVNAGAVYIGFVFFAKSPRAVSPEGARALAAEIPPGIAKVGLVVDPSDDEIAAITKVAPLDMLQLHGAEPPARVTEIRVRTGLPVMKAVGVRDAGDVAGIDDYAGVADQILIDAKPPDGAAIPGGNGLAFDWRLISGQSWSVPWMLAGGLTPATVAEGIALTGARQVDVSSGVETSPGKKDVNLIRRFIEAAG